MSRKLSNIIGKQIGNLLVIRHILDNDEFYKNKKSNFKTYWECKCNCGNITFRSTSQLNRALKKQLEGKITLISCGCLRGSYVKNNKIYKNDPKITSLNGHIHDYKCNAKKRNLSWNLSDDEAYFLFASNCFYCNAKPNILKNAFERWFRHRHKKLYQSDVESKKYDIYVNGIDRLDNTKGYFVENCVSCCTQCNRAKLNYTFNEFLNWIEAITNNIIQNQDKFEQFRDKNRQI